MYGKNTEADRKGGSPIRWNKKLTALTACGALLVLLSAFFVGVPVNADSDLVGWSAWIEEETFHLQVHPLHDFLALKHWGQERKEDSLTIHVRLVLCLPGQEERSGGVAVDVTDIRDIYFGDRKMYGR